MLYNEIGETSNAAEEWVLEKKMLSNKVQQELGERSRSIRVRMRELKPYVEKGELHTLFRPDRPSPAKRAKISVKEQHD